MLKVNAMFYNQNEELVIEQIICGKNIEEIDKIAHKILDNSWEYEFELYEGYAKYCGLELQSYAKEFL